MRQKERLPIDIALEIEKEYLREILHQLKIINKQLNQPRQKYKDEEMIEESIEENQRQRGVKQLNYNLIHELTRVNADLTKTIKTNKTTNKNIIPKLCENLEVTNHLLLSCYIFRLNYFNPQTINKVRKICDDAYDEKKEKEKGR